MSEDPIYESPVAETQDILDRTEALAVRQRQQVEQSRTQLLEKLSRVQDEHSDLLAQQGEKLVQILSILHGSNSTQ